MLKFSLQILFLLLVCMRSSHADIYIDRDDLPVSQIKPATSSESTGKVTAQNQDEFSNYIIQSGNLLEITVKQDPKLDGNYRVDHAGHIDFPLIGKLIAGGKNPQQLTDELSNRLEQDFIRNPLVTVLIREYTLPIINLSGAFNLPGTYILTGKVSLTEAIRMAGGPTINADLSRIKITRVTKNLSGTSSSSEVYDYALIKNGEKADPLLIGDEQIVIDELLPIMVEGGVLKPGPVFALPGSSLRHVLKLAGGVTKMADITTIKITTYGKGKGLADQVYDLEKIAAGQVKEPILEPGQRILIAQCTSKVRILGKELCIKNRDVIKKNSE